jgi:hypothetical protein
MAGPRGKRRGSGRYDPRKLVSVTPRRVERISAALGKELLHDADEKQVD